MVDLKKVLVSTGVFILLLGLFTGFTFAADDANKVGVITGSVVNLREAANTSSTVLAKLPQGIQVKVISSSNGWVKAVYNNLTGWICGDYISVSDANLGTGTVTTEVLNVRSSASTDSNVILKLKEGGRVTVLSRSGDWYKIKTSGDVTGWVFGEYISLKGSSTSRGGEVERTVAADGVTGEQIVEYAKKFLGTQYVYGGNSPKEGFDCSGFTKYVYAHFGISLERTAAEQAGQGVKVKKDDLKVGDLIFFDTNGGLNSINHVAMYIGNGKFIHAASTRLDVTITQLTENYYERSFMTARRILK